MLTRGQPWERKNVTVLLPAGAVMRMLGVSFPIHSTASATVAKLSSRYLHASSPPSGRFHGQRCGWLSAQLAICALHCWQLRECLRFEHRPAFQTPWEQPARWRMLRLAAAALQGRLYKTTMKWAHAVKAAAWMLSTPGIEQLGCG